MNGKYFNDNYSSIDEFRATAEKVIQIKILKRKEKTMTKREIQKHENILVENAWLKAKKVWDNTTKRIDEFERLNHCQAKTYQTRGYSFLISYNTIVAFIDDSGNMFDVLRLVYGYTATSSMHINKFRLKFRQNSKHTWREV